MKCEFCGSNLGLEDEVCPACGKPNQFARKHNMDMKKFKSNYDSTREEVVENSRRFNKLTVRITTIAVLVALVAASIVAKNNSFEIERARREKVIEKRLDEHKAKLDKLIENRDYIGVYFYSNAYGLSYSDHMKEYSKICEISRTYWTFNDYLHYLLDEDSHMDDGEAIGNLEDIARRIHEFKNPSEWEKEKYYDERTEAYIEDLTDHMDVMVQGIFNLSDEDMKTFWELSDARRKVIMEENYEKELQ